MTVSRIIIGVMYSMPGDERNCLRFIYFAYKKNRKDMSSGALFGGTSGRSQSKNLVEFRAGKMTMKGRTVYPDKRKGTVYIYQSDDSLMHFCWRERSKSMAEDVNYCCFCLTEYTQDF